MLLDFDVYRKYCVYIDTSVVKDRKESTARRYPGVKSYGAPKIQKVKRIAKTQLKKVGKNPNWSNIARKLLKESNEQFELVIEPDAWIKAYSEDCNGALINKWITAQVAKEQSHKPCVGRKRVFLGSFSK